MSENRIVRRVVIRGLVQGVGFRAWTRGQAELHGVSGEVRNREDGSVEALLAGPSDAVEMLIRALHEGPRGSRVDAVGIEELPAEAAPHAGHFRIERDA